MTPEEKAEIVAAVKADLEVTPLAVGGFYQVAPGQTILSDHMNTALVNGVPKFANAAARDTQWPSPPQGAMCYLNDVNYWQVYDAAITGGTNHWRVASTLRMGYGQMGSQQTIATSAETRLKIYSAGGAANRPGRATWTLNQDYVTVPLTGNYLVVADVTWPGNPTGERAIWTKRSTGGGAYSLGGVAGGSQETNQSGGGSGLRQTTVSVMACVAGDKIASSVYQSSGISLTLPQASSGSDTASLVIQFLGED